MKRLLRELYARLCEERGEVSLENKNEEPVEGQVDSDDLEFAKLHAEITGQEDAEPNPEDEGVPPEEEEEPTTSEVETPPDDGIDEAALNAFLKSKGYDGSIDDAIADAKAKKTHESKHQELAQFNAAMKRNPRFKDLIMDMLTEENAVDTPPEQLRDKPAAEIDAYRQQVSYLTKPQLEALENKILGTVESKLEFKDFLIQGDNRNEFPKYRNTMALIAKKHGVTGGTSETYQWLLDQAKQLHRQAVESQKPPSKTEKKVIGAPPGGNDRGPKPPRKLETDDDYEKAYQEIIKKFGVQ